MVIEAFIPRRRPLDVKKITADNFTEIVHSLGPSLNRYFYVRTFGHVQESEDMTQETLLRIWDNCDQYHGPSLEAWTFGIARNLFIDQLRRKNSRPKSVYFEDLKREPIYDPSSTFARVELQNDFLKSMSQCSDLLTEDQWEVIHLRFIEEFTPTEIAHIMKRNVNSIKSIQHRAVGILRENESMKTLMGKNVI